MERTIIKRIKGVPVVQDNGQGGCIYIGPDSSYINVIQKDVVTDEHGTCIEHIDCKIMGPIETSLEALTNSINIAPGRTMQGELRVYKRYSPIDPEDPLLFMSMDGYGVPIKEEGRYVWSYVEYIQTED